MALSRNVIVIAGAAALVGAFGGLYVGNGWQERRMADVLLATLYRDAMIYTRVLYGLRTGDTTGLIPLHETMIDTSKAEFDRLLVDFPSLAR